MSGPKLSEAEIERLRQEKLERERQEALRRLIEARKQYNSVCNEVESIKCEILNSLSTVDFSYRDKIQPELKTLLDGINNVNIMSSNPEEYIIQTQRIKGMLESWKSKLVAVLNTGRIKTVNDKNLSDRNVDLQKISLDRLKRTSELEPVKMDFTCQYDEKQIEKILQNMRIHYENRLNLKVEPRMVSFDKKALAVIRQLTDKKSSVDNIKIEIQQIINEEENQIRLLKQFDKLYDEYVAVSLVLAIKPRQKREVTFETLKEEIEILKKEYKRRDEMDFIADQINEVMIKQGYSFVSSKVLTKKDEGETEYSLYQEEGNAGVAVYTDDSGAVMMRMTVLGDGGEITDEDREFSYQSQIEFCSRHSDLVDALAERGVYLKQKSYKSPNRQHTFKVDVSDQINVLNNSTIKATSKTQKVDRRDRRRGGNKKMRTVQI